MINLVDVIKGTHGTTGPIDLSMVLDSIGDLLPVVLPVIVGFIAFRKGYAFLKGSLRSA